MYNIDKMEKIFIYVFWPFTEAVQMKFDNVDRKVYVFNRHCEIPPDSFYVFENGPMFLRQCATNSTDSPIWGELDSNFTEAVQMKFDNVDRKVVCLQSALRDSARLVLRLRKAVDQCFWGNAQQTPLTPQSGESWIQTLQRRYRWNLTMSTEKLYVFNRHCEIPPDSFYVFENGPMFLRQCATNSTDSPIWGELDSNFTEAVQMKFDDVNRKVVCLQSALRDSARIALRFRKWTSVSEAMRNKLHWLPNLGRVGFKLCSTIKKTNYRSVWHLHNNEPSYVSELCIPVAKLPGRCHLWSAAFGDLFVSTAFIKTIGPREFIHAGLEQSTSCSLGPIVIILNV